MESGFERLWAGVAWLVGIKGGGGEWEGARFESEVCLCSYKDRGPYTRSLVTPMHRSEGEGARR